MNSKDLTVAAPSSGTTSRATGLHHYAGLNSQPKPKLATSGQGWVEGYSAGAVKGIGALEVAGALGLVLPGLLGIAPALVGWAAVGIVVLMIGAGITHARRGEYSNVVVNVVLAVLAAAVAVARFGPYAF